MGAGEAIRAETLETNWGGRPPVHDVAAPSRYKALKGWLAKDIAA